MAQIDASSFDPDTIALLRKVLADTEGVIPIALRSSEVRVKLASGILAAAAEGERDPSRLRSAGLLSIDRRVVGRPRLAGVAAFVVPSASWGPRFAAANLFWLDFS